jgi:chromosome segregation ATPase
MGIAGGALLGYGFHNAISEPEVVVQTPEVIKETMSEEELLALCADAYTDDRDRLSNSQGRVVDLQAELEARERELAEMKAEADRDAAGAAAAATRWKEMEQTIAELEIRLAAAEEERERLVEELRETVQQLDEQIKETQKYKTKARRYKRERTTNLWAAFTANAKVRICDRGSRKRHEKCHEAIETAFDLDRRDRFTMCVDTYQSVPVLVENEAKRELPAFAEWVDEDEKFLKHDWYVLFCDPTLPEADDDDFF